MFVKESQAYFNVEVDKPESMGNMTLPQGGETCNRTRGRGEEEEKAYLLLRCLTSEGGSVVQVSLPLDGGWPAG